jgi:hypothetical protein
MFNVRRLEKRPRNRWTPLCVLIAVAASALCSPAAAKTDQFEGPRFRKGVWHFVRKIEQVHKLSHANVLLAQQESTRCVDPTLAMVHTFTSPDVGSCRSEKPQIRAGQYIFPMRCDFMGPVRTEITVESDARYTEVNELVTGDFPRKETVVARRVGDCGS